MNGADYIIQKLIDAGVTDAFGIPGGVLLELLYGFDRFKSHIQFHLTNHEQDAGYAAIAYAQASHRVGVLASGENNLHESGEINQKKSKEKSHYQF